MSPTFTPLSIRFRPKGTLNAAPLLSWKDATVTKATAMMMEWLAGRKGGWVSSKGSEMLGKVSPAPNRGDNMGGGEMGRDSFNGRIVM